MKISELQLRQGNVDVTAEVVEKGDIREFDKFGRKGRVCTVKIKDGSGEVALTLWNEDIDKVNVGDEIHLTNGYVGEWQGEPQLTTGRLGKIEVLEQTKGEQKKEEKLDKKVKNKNLEKKKTETKKEIFSNKEYSGREYDAEGAEQEEPSPSNVDEEEVM